MVGFIESWKISGVTSSEARVAKPMIELGYYLFNRIEFWSMEPAAIEEIMEVGEKNCSNEKVF